MPGALVRYRVTMVGTMGRTAGHDNPPFVTETTTQLYIPPANLNAAARQPPIFSSIRLRNQQDVKSSTITPTQAGCGA